MLYINSPGGVVYSGFAIYDTIRKLKSPASTVAVGFAAAWQTVLLSSRCQRTTTLCASLCHCSHASCRRKGYTEDVRIAYRE
ncbi:MAG: ATP-dependent Clp protease proteolytic subunit [Chitinophagaceae bacterium]|nr:ATP-dependent Clp protease proteolytic subunit [Chitinophagaceae bacterium]